MGYTEEELARLTSGAARVSGGQRIAKGHRHVDSEDVFQRWVIARLDEAGWTLVYHTHDSRRSQPGFPDIAAVFDGTAHRRRGPCLLLAELKGYRSDGRGGHRLGTTSPEQDRWLAGLRAVAAVSGGAIDVRLWTPNDRDEILEVIGWG